MRVLIVEDEGLIAIEIEHILTSAGFEVAGPVASAKEALALVSTGQVEGAVLDVNLGRETSEAVAAELASRGVPFIAVSGYASDQRPAVFNGAPFLAKPFRARELLAAVRGLSH
jgi:DNA-binding response OmpR family regulator